MIVSRPITPSPSRSGPPQETPVRPNERPNERPLERKKTRHTFDIFPDQLIALRELAIQRERRVGRRVLLGDLVQEALDLFIRQERQTK